MTPAQAILTRYRDSYRLRSDLHFVENEPELAAEMYRRALVIDAILDEVRDAEKQGTP